MKIRNERLNKRIIDEIINGTKGKYPEIEESQKAIRIMKQKNMTTLKQALIGR